MKNIDRREFLKTTGMAVGTAALSESLMPNAFARPLLSAPSYKTKHVIFIAFAGGVRSNETIGTPENIPNLMRIAGKGVVCPNMQAQNVGHYGAALSIFTGSTEIFGIRENGRSNRPTVFEYARKQLDLPANDVWLSTTGGNQQVNFSHGTHKDYGARYKANLLSPDGVFNAEFRGIIDDFGQPKVLSEKETDLESRLRDQMDRSAKEGGLDASGGNQRDVEKFILSEIAGETTNLTGPGAADAKAVRIASNIFRVFRPKLLGIALNQCDVAHGSYNGYVEIIRRNDQEIGSLLDSIEADPDLRDSTTVMVVPEFGRDRNLNERNGLDHGDGSEELGKVAMFASGPDFKQGMTANQNMRTTDICPTICRLMGIRPDHTKGNVMTGIFA